MNKLKEHLQELLKNKKTQNNPFLSNDDNGTSTYYDSNTKDPLEYKEDNYWGEE